MKLLKKIEIFRKFSLKNRTFYEITWKKSQFFENLLCDFLCEFACKKIEIFLENLKFLLNCLKNRNSWNRIFLNCLKKSKFSVKLPKKSKFFKNLHWKIGIFCKITWKKSKFFGNLPWKIDYFDEIAWKNRNLFTRIHDSPSFQTRLTPLLSIIGLHLFSSQEPESFETFS